MLSTSDQVQIELHAAWHRAPCVKTNDRGAGISTPRFTLVPKQLAADVGVPLVASVHSSLVMHGLHVIQRPSVSQRAGLCRTIH